MKSVVIKGSKRESLGKKDAKKLRVDGNVPCVLYGGEEPVHFYAPFNEFRKVVYTPSTFLIDLDVEGEKYKAMVQDVQWHAIEEQILHVDFLLVREDKRVKIEIPVKTVGLAEGIKAGGKLITNLRKLKVRAFAKDLPDFVELDVESLNIGQNIKVSDIKIDNVEFLNTSSNVIVSVNVTRLAKAALAADEAAAEAAAAAEGEEGAEGAETAETTGETKES